MIRYLIPLMLVLSSCSSTPDTSYTEFRKVLAFQNTKLHQKLASDPKFKFLSFTLDDYKKLMAEQSPNLLKQIEAFDEVQLGTAPYVFVICMKSAKNNILICDNSKSPMVDRIKTIAPLPDMKKTMDEIRG